MCEIHITTHEPEADKYWDFDNVIDLKFDGFISVQLL